MLRKEFLSKLIVQNRVPSAQQPLSMLAFLGIGSSKSSIGRYKNDFELVVRSTKEVKAHYMKIVVFILIEK
jgi:hypothetical protein